MKQTNKALQAKISELENQIKKMEEDTKYNGWSNYETWLVALWLDNEEGTQREAERIVRASADRARAGRGLKEMCEEMMPDLGVSFPSDLLNAAFSSVDFYEIADHYMVEAELEDANA